MAAYPDKEIPVSVLAEGVVVALARSAALLGDARTAAEKGSTLGPAVLLSQAVEEFAKAAMLRAALREGASIVRDFYDHEAKLSKGAELLPAGGLMVYEAMLDADEYFDAERTLGGESADDWQTRKDWLYVGWIERDRRWRDVPRIDLAVLTKNIAAVQTVVAAKRREWAENG